MTENTNDMLTSSLVYAASGLFVLPNHTIDPDGRCSCRKSNCSSPGKHPRTPNGFKDATTDPAVITQWWTRWPNSNIGIATGRISGIFVIDVDPKNGGDQSLAKLEAELGPLPRDYVVETSNGGLHFYYAYPDNEEINCKPFKPYSGIDIRGDGGYVIAPPSKHISGHIYRRIQC